MHLRQSVQSQDGLSSLEPLKGSYSLDDCKFLLTPIDMVFQDIGDKEALIQSGKAHYSEMVSEEHPPTEEYKALFDSLLEKYGNRLAAHIYALGVSILKLRDNGDITLVSLARAGTPIGVLLKRTLEFLSFRDVEHYSVSIIRDRGIDTVALDYILEQEGRDPSSIVWVDGWTAKGVITRELKKFIAEYNALRSGSAIPDDLFVVSDIGGVADYSATCLDYAIPSGLLNSTVSGLVSRSILNEKVLTGSFHGCVLYSNLRPFDVSNYFVEHVYSLIKNISEEDFYAVLNEKVKPVAMERFLERLQREYSVTDINRIKPGIAEATRAMLRRVPDLLLVSGMHNDDVTHLLRLAEEKDVEVIEVPDLGLGAATIIRDVV